MVPWYRNSLPGISPPARRRWPHCAIRPLRHLKDAYGMCASAPTSPESKDDPCGNQKSTTANSEGQMAKPEAAQLEIDDRVVWERGISRESAGPDR